MRNIRFFYKFIILTFVVGVCILSLPTNFETLVNAVELGGQCCGDSDCTSGGTACGALDATCSTVHCGGSPNCNATPKVYGSCTESWGHCNSTGSCVGGGGGGCSETNTDPVAPTVQVCVDDVCYSPSLDPNNPLIIQKPVGKITLKANATAPSGGRGIRYLYRVDNENDLFACDNMYDYCYNEDVWVSNAETPNMFSEIGLDYGVDYHLWVHSGSVNKCNDDVKTNDPNSITNAYFRVDIQHYCGDGTTDTGNGEQCDDGGTTPNDGCSATCQKEVWPQAYISAKDYNNGSSVIPNTIHLDTSLGAGYVTVHRNADSVEDVLLDFGASAQFGYKINKAEVHYKKQYTDDGTAIDYSAFLDPPTNSIPNPVGRENVAVAKAECTAAGFTPAPGEFNPWCLISAYDCGQSSCDFLTSAGSGFSWNINSMTSGYYQVSINAYAENQTANDTACTGNRWCDVKSDGLAQPGLGEFSRCSPYSVVTPSWYDCDSNSTQDGSTESDSLLIKIEDYCGNNFTEDGEQCDAGLPLTNDIAYPDDVTDGSCLMVDGGPQCVTNECGDGYLDLTETCDFGILNGTGLGCSSSCGLESTPWFKTTGGDLYSSDGVSQTMPDLDGNPLTQDEKLSTYTCLRKSGDFTLGGGGCSFQGADSFWSINIGSDDLETSVNQEFAKIQTKLEDQFINNSLTFINGGIYGYKNHVGDFANSNVLLNGMFVDRNIVYYKTGTLTIDQNIKYSPTCANQKACSLLIVVNGDVQISPDVEHIDAFIIASGKVTVNSNL